ncbi:MAG TPA: outer membrane lipoprotein-sorting protein [Acidobacteriaceae bacterium]|nr:outer membrane lipoprotein-sorting protein [Acidobacteriaceae bacterium]
MLAVARQRIETSDFRATGRLVRVDAGGNRISNNIAIKARWFPGVLRALVEIAPLRRPAGNARQDARVSILLEMRPKGQNTIRIFRSHESAPASLPFDKWGESVFGSDFNYEDFLQPEYYWQGQTLLKSARFGTHDCDVLKSTPGALDHSHYAEVQTWLDHTIGYPVYVEKTLKDGGIVKEFTYFGLSRSGGVWSARQVEVKIHGRPGSTLLIIERGSTKANLSIRDFSPEQISKFEDRP